LSADRRAAVHAAWVGALAAGALVVTFVFSRSGLQGLPCLFRTAFHLPCPGCGMTRSVTCIWQGDLNGSVRYHFLGPLVFAGLVVVVVWCTVYVVMPSGRPGLERMASVLRGRRVAWAALAALLIGWVVRLLDAAMGTGVFRW